MTPSERVMPVCEARYSDVSRRWTVALPFGVALEASTAFDVEMLVLKHAPGSAVRYVRDALRANEVERPEAPRSGRPLVRPERITALASGE